MKSFIMNLSPIALDEKRVILDAVALNSTVVFSSFFNIGKIQQQRLHESTKSLQHSNGRARTFALTIISVAFLIVQSFIV